MSLPRRTLVEKPRLLDSVRAVARLRHLCIRTGRAYSGWITRFILARRKRHPGEGGAGEVRQPLSHSAVEGSVAASTQSVALCARLLLHRGVLHVAPPYVEGIERARPPARLPVVFTRAAAAALLSRLSGAYGLSGGLLYGSGRRLMGARRLRVKDADFGYMETLARDGKGGKGRRAILPRPLAEPQRHQLERVKAPPEQDQREGFGEVCLPYALGRK